MAGQRDPTTPWVWSWSTLAENRRTSTPGMHTDDNQGVIIGDGNQATRHVGTSKTYE